MTYKSRCAILDSWWKSPWCKLPNEPRQAWNDILSEDKLQAWNDISRLSGDDERDAAQWWDKLSPDHRKLQAEEFDYLHDPEREDERTVDFSGGFEEASYNGVGINWPYWMSMPKLTAHEFSCLMCVLDPDIVDAGEVTADAADLLQKAQMVERLALREGMTEATAQEWLSWAKERRFKVYNVLLLEVERSAAARNEGIFPIVETSDEPKKVGVLVTATETDKSETNKQGAPVLAKAAPILGNRINENRAFLQNCISSNIPPNIESIWLHIREHVGRENFLFKSASASTATTIDGKQVQKKNLARTLRGLPAMLKNKQ